MMKIKKHLGLFGLMFSLIITTSFGMVSHFASAATLFSDNFENGSASNWTVSSGTWSVVQDNGSYVYYQSSTSEGRTSAGDQSWTDYSVQADVKVDNFNGSNRAYVAGRYRDGNNFYAASLYNSNGGTLEIRKKVNGSATTLATMANFGLSTGTWYTVKLELAGSTINMYVNGVLQLTATDTSLSSGAVGLDAYKTLTKYDNIVVSDTTSPTPSPSPSPSPTPTPTPTPTPSPSDLGHQVLASNDGWAAYSTGTTGGSAADSTHTYVVTNRSEFVSALGGATNTTPKIIYVQGTIDFNVDDNNNPLGYNDYKDPAYDFNTYLATYDPSVWGTSKLPSGPQEDARVRSEKNQKAQMLVYVPSNTTIVGQSGTQATFVGGSLYLTGADNVIIRNIEFQDTYDYFPQWDPTDGSTGNWNSMFDNITIKTSTHVWVDHCTFDDGSRPDNPNDNYYGRNYQHHDGTVDISNAADLVTLSYNYFHDHDKTELIGGSDSASGDNGHLRVTIHHNYYQNLEQRVARVRYGQVHIYNNYYVGDTNATPYPYLYSWGIGYSSKIYAENNYFNVTGATASDLASKLKGTTLYDTGTVLNGSNVTVYSSLGLSGNVGWTPTLHLTIDPTSGLPTNVPANAGAGKL